MQTFSIILILKQGRFFILIASIFLSGCISQAPIPSGYTEQHKDYSSQELILNETINSNQFNCYNQELNQSFITPKTISIQINNNLKSDINLSNNLSAFMSKSIHSLESKKIAINYYGEEALESAASYYSRTDFMILGNVENIQKLKYSKFEADILGIEDGTAVTIKAITTSFRLIDLKLKQEITSEIYTIILYELENGSSIFKIFYGDVIRGRLSFTVQKSVPQGVLYSTDKVLFNFLEKIFKYKSNCNSTKNILKSTKNIQFVDTVFNEKNELCIIPKNTNSDVKYILIQVFNNLTNEKIYKYFGDFYHSGVCARLHHQNKLEYQISLFDANKHHMKSIIK